MLFNKNIKIRTISAMVILFSMFFLCIGRVASVAVIQSEKADNTISVTLESGRGDFYFSGGEKITGSKKIYANVFLPNESSKEIFLKNATDEEKEIGNRAFLNNRPAILKREEKICGTGIYNFEIEDRYGYIYSLEHIIGYVNGDNVGVSALEKGYEEVLKSEKNITVDFYVDAAGNHLLGADPTINENKSNSKVYLTVDKKIQQICVEAAENMKKGAVVVSEISSGKIRGILSKPGYNINEIHNYLNTESAPFLNRAVSCFNVGSVFKPMIACVLCENNKQNFKFNCTGSNQISGINFHCYKRSGHGEMDLNNAIALSCNSYFYNAINQLNPKCFLNLSAALMFKQKIKLAPNIYSALGRLPDENTLKNPAAAANFSIGQGEILLSPIALNNLYSCIAGEGVYYAPTLIEKVNDNGKSEKIKPNAKTTAISKATAAQVKEFLYSAVLYGTGKEAAPDNLKVAGKTGTAQTGKFKGNEEITSSWFCGFFPFDKPEYAVTVFFEEANSESETTVNVFKSIADKIYKNCP